jgi:transcriptional regulator with XRE-family HTH domain
LAGRSAAMKDFPFGPDLPQILRCSKKFLVGCSPERRISPRKSRPLLRIWQMRRSLPETRRPTHGLPEFLRPSWKKLRICSFCLTSDRSRPNLPRMPTFTRDDYRRLAVRIKEKREAFGWKQRELSLRAGIASDRLSRLERGAMVRVDELIGLSGAFGVALEELVFGAAGRARDGLDGLAQEIRTAVPAEDLPAVTRILQVLLAGFRSLRTLGSGGRA